MSTTADTQPANVPVYGLLLAGGRSSRMRRDKAALEYHGRSQLAHAYERLAAKVERAFVSVRPDQVEDPVRRAYPQVVDRRENLGPLAGILAAQEAHPGVAWLVLACDLPFLDAHTLGHLLGARDTGGLATAYRSAHDGLIGLFSCPLKPKENTRLGGFGRRGAVGLRVGVQILRAQPG